MEETGAWEAAGGVLGVQSGGPDQTEHCPGPPAAAPAEGPACPRFAGVREPREPGRARGGSLGCHREPGGARKGEGPLRTPPRPPLTPQGLGCIPPGDAVACVPQPAPLGETLPEPGWPGAGPARTWTPTKALEPAAPWGGGSLRFKAPTETWPKPGPRSSQLWGCLGPGLQSGSLSSRCGQPA